MIPDMDYSLIHHSPDGTGMFLVTIPGTPDRGSYMTEQEFKEWIVSSIGGGIVPKGDILSTNLPPADDTNKGWQYYCTDLNKYAISDGTAWIYFSNSPIVQTPDATDTGHALSNAVVTQCCNEVKGRLDQHESRLENLEQKAGDYSIVQYRGTNAVPTGKAKYGLVKSIVGKTRAWNQLVPNDKTSFSNTQTDTKTVFEFVIRMSNPALYILQTNVSQTGPFLAIVVPSASTSCSFRHNGLIQDIDFFSLDLIANHKYIVAINFTGIDCQTVGGLAFNHALVRDLTLIFGSGNEPSTVADALAQLPALGQYNAYDAGSLVDTTVTGVEARGRNLIDWSAITADAFVRSTDGVVQPYGSGEVKVTDYIPVIGGSSYYLGGNTATMTGNLAAVYDINKNYIGGYTSDSELQPVTVPVNAAYVRINIWTVHWTDPENSAYFTLNSNPHAFTPYKTDTLSLSTPVTLRSASNSFADTVNVETGKIVRKCVSYTITGDETYEFKAGTQDGHYAVVINYPTEMSDVRKVLDAVVKTDLGLPYNYANNDKVFYYSPAAFVIINDDWTTEEVFMQNIIGKTFVSALTNLVTEQATPIIDNTIATEGGGTIETIQTQSPVIDNCLDVGYLAV